MFFQPRYLVYPAHTRVIIELLPQGPVALSPADTYLCTLQPFSGFRRYSANKRGGIASEAEIAAFPRETLVSGEGGALRLPLSFPQEDRWILKVSLNGAVIDTFELYSLEADLFSLRPFKGDCHMHSYMSDGKDSPAYMLAASCRRGYDYCALTDHSQMAPSVSARDALAALDTDFLALSGEEIHAPGNNVHIINLGGEKSVNDWYRDDPDGYAEAVGREAARIAEPMGEEDKWAAASSQVIFDKIREYGGVSVFCHPGWVQAQKLQQSEDITEYLFDHKRFDALELIAGGAFEEGTQYQLSLYHDLPEMPILGNSDAHQQFGGRLEPGNFTIAFAPALSREAILNAYRKGLCAAGNENKFYGNYRLVKFTYFLKANVFAAHDALSAKLGVKLLRWASAGADAAGKYADEARECQSPVRFINTVWYKED